MSYLALLWKARTIEKCRLKYEREKINSILATKAELPRNTLYQKWTLYSKDSQKRIEQICRCPEGSKVANSCTCLKENSSFLLSIVIGIAGGIVLMYCLYEVFVVQVAVSRIVSWMIAVVITLGIVLSSSIRCLLLLLLPGLFSRVGRYTLACYALVLILTGPATNTIKNLNTLSDSLACGQEQIKSSIRQIKESKDSPLNLVKDTISETVDKIQYLADKMKEMLVKTHRLTLSIAHVLQSSLSWLNSVETTCNTKLGTPYKHCIKTLFKGSEECSREFPEFSKIWSFDDVVRAVCFTLKPADPMCVVGDFSKGSIVAAIKKKLNTFSSRVQSLLSLSVHIHRSHSYCSNGSFPISQAAAGIVTGLRNRADPLLTWLSWSCTLTGLFLLLIIFRAKYYQLMFRTRSRFDNRYVTREFRELDLKRQRQGRETVLPLNTRERSKYVSTASFRLLPSERMYLTRSIVFMVITTFKLMIHMVADYSLYWVLMNIRFHGSAQTESRPGNRAVSIDVSGSGPLAATVRTLAEALSVPLEVPISSPKSCLPDPNPPDLQRYAHIGTIILLLWLLALFEPYGLRLRHVITGLYQPDRAKARAVWLYYHIIRTRSCFLKCARRKLHRQYKYTSEAKYTFKNWLNDCIPSAWLRTLLGVGPDEPRCLLCFTKHRQDDLHRRLKRCETPSCPGIYCSRCFMDIGLLCTICYEPEEYGDFSDVSQEKFDSDDSESDDTDDDYNDDNKRLLGSPGFEMKEDSIQSNLLNKNVSGNFSKSRSSYGNQESIPLLDNDYLNKDYSHQDTNNISAQCELKENNHVKDKNSSNVLFRRNMQGSYLSTQLTRLIDRKRTLNGFKNHKGKLGVIMTKMDNGKILKYDNRNKPYQYTNEELCLEVTKRMTVPRQTGYDNNNINKENKNKALKKEIPRLFVDIMFPTSAHNTAVLTCAKVSTDSKQKTLESDINRLQNDFKGKIATMQLPKHKKNTRKRNVRRYLELKQIITTHLFQLQKRNIHFTDRKYSWKRQRRRKKHSNKIGTVSNVLHDKSLKNDEKRITKLKKNIKRRRHGKNTTVVETASHLPNKTGNSLSNFATGDNYDIRPNNTFNDASVSRENNENTVFEIDRTIDHKATDLSINQQQSKDNKVGFWGRLGLKITRQCSISYANIPSDEPLWNNSHTNHKRRKKKYAKDQTQANTLTRIVNNDARNYRIALFLDDHSCFTRLHNNYKQEEIVYVENKPCRCCLAKEVVDVEDDKPCRCLAKQVVDVEDNKTLTKQVKRFKREEVKNMKREIKTRLLNEAKNKKAELKTKWNEEKQISNQYYNTEKQLFSCASNESKTKEKTNDCGFKNILKVIISPSSLSTKRKQQIDVPDGNDSAQRDDDDDTKINYESDDNLYKNETIEDADYHNNSSSNAVVEEDDFTTDNTTNNIYGSSTPTENPEHKIKYSQTPYCSHIWHVEPMTHNGCQTRNKCNYCNLQSTKQKMQQTCQPKTKAAKTCVNMLISPGEHERKVTFKTLRKKMSTQCQDGFHCHSKKLGIGKKERCKTCKHTADKDINVYPEQTSCGCQHEVILPFEKEKDDHVIPSMTLCQCWSISDIDKSRLIKVNVCPEQKSREFQCRVNPQINKEPQAHTTSYVNQKLSCIDDVDECCVKKVNVCPEQTSSGFQCKVNPQINKESQAQTTSYVNQKRCLSCIEDDDKCCVQKVNVCPEQKSRGFQCRVNPQINKEPQAHTTSYVNQKLSCIDDVDECCVKKVNVCPEQTSRGFQCRVNPHINKEPQAHTTSYVNQKLSCIDDVDECCVKKVNVCPEHTSRGFQCRVNPQINKEPQAQTTSYVNEKSSSCHEKLTPREVYYKANPQMAPCVKPVECNEPQPLPCACVDQYSSCHDELTPREVYNKANPQMAPCVKPVECNEPQPLPCACVDQYSSCHDELTPREVNNKASPQMAPCVKPIECNEPQPLPCACVNHYSDKKVNSPEQQSRGCQHKITIQINNETQTRRTCNPEHKMTQYCKADKKVNICQKQQSQGGQQEITIRINNETQTQRTCTLKHKITQYCRACGPELQDAPKSASSNPSLWSGAGPSLAAWLHRLAEKMNCNSPQQSSGGQYGVTSQSKEMQTILIEESIDCECPPCNDNKEDSSAAELQDATKSASSNPLLWSGAGKSLSTWLHSLAEKINPPQQSSGCQYGTSQSKEMQTICIEEFIECEFPLCDEKQEDLLNVISEESVCRRDTTMDYTDAKTTKSKTRDNVTNMSQNSTWKAMEMSDGTTVTSDWWSPILEKKQIAKKSWRDETPDDWEVSLNIDPGSCSSDATESRKGELSAKQYLLQSAENYHLIYPTDGSSSKWSFSRIHI